jgi:hypothetical protein
VLLGIHVGPPRHFGDNRGQAGTIKLGDFGQGVALDAAIQEQGPALSKRVSIGILVRAGPNE